MSIKQVSKIKWLAGIIVGSSISIVLIVIGIIIALVWTIHPDPVTGITDTTVENAVFFGGLYFALPFGLLSVGAGIYARSKGMLNKLFTTTGIIVGFIGALIGLLCWIWFMMVSSFVF
ncbi:MAG: hypothetical protein NTW32_25990 [Chloroflexi bacterium]|nr:hypothetical protein [Chloroflexota bacterium]